MPKSINKKSQNQIIGGIFNDCENAHKAVKAFQNLKILRSNIQIIVKKNGEDAEDSYTNLLVHRGFSQSQALYHNKVIRAGKVLVAVYEIEDPAPVIDIFDQFGAEFNPNGSRNLRLDVAGMTVGAALGAAAGGVAGGVVAGPVGAIAGAAAGVLIGAGSGVAAGKVLEHNK